MNNRPGNAGTGLSIGESLLGLSPPTNRPPNTYSLSRYLFILSIVLLGCLYAAPNLFPPDPALQLRAKADRYVVSDEVVAESQRLLGAAGIDVVGAELTADGALIRLADKDDQLAAQATLLEELNRREDRFAIALNRAATTPGWLADLGGKPMALGLDLSGGVHFLLQVDLERAIGERVGNAATAMRDTLREEARLRTPRADTWVSGETLRIPFRSAEDRDAAVNILEEAYPDYLFTSRPVGTSDGIVAVLRPEVIEEFEGYAIDQNLQSIRNRVNELGVSEPLVQRFGRNRIVVDLPGIQDAARAKIILNKFANLEFRLVDVDGARPSQTETYEYEDRRYQLDVRNIVTGDSVTNATQGFDPETQQPQVNITLDQEGGSKMLKATGPNIGNPMAIVFKESIPFTRTVTRDGKEVQEYDLREEERLINVATIQGALGNRFRITGLGLMEARDLSLLLRAGALAAPMYIVEERTVGASLGDDNIAKGQLSVLIGLGLVLLFMLVYYKLFGLAANLALTANLILLVAIMSILGATLTLPGIAGIVLTVGMAVDANVLIFSRIREELHNRPPQQAIQAGFDRAFLTILDANVTTFFVAIILLSIGSGPVKGFAVTLAVGIVTSMFTAILGTRALVNLMYGGRKLQKITI